MTVREWLRRSLLPSEEVRLELLRQKEEHLAHDAEVAKEVLEVRGRIRTHERVIAQSREPEPTPPKVAQKGRGKRAKKGFDATNFFKRINNATKEATKTLERISK